MHHKRFYLALAIVILIFIIFSALARKNTSSVNQANTSVNTNTAGNAVSSAPIIPANIAPVPAPPASPTPSQQATLPILAIGPVSRHPKNYVNKQVAMAGYVLKQEKGYAIFSDENGGAIGYYDLPVSGPGVDSLKQNQKYTIEGILKYGGLAASNNNPYHLDLTVLPK